MIALLLLGCAGSGPARPEFVSSAAEVMSTRLEVTLPAEHAALGQRVVAIFSEVEATANEWREGSPLAAVSRGAGGAPVPIPPDLMRLLRRGLELGDQTGGAFDITWAALWGLWDFRAERPAVPEAAEIEARTARVDYRQLELDEAAGTARLAREGMVLGLGGLAKGWALDRAAAALRAEGVQDFNLVIGGQVYAGGRRGDRPWRVGVRDPRGDPRDVFAAVEVSDVSVSTSGDYERYFERDGVRYHHILDPRTGWPARGVRSATVIAREAAAADALSTALVVMGVAEGLAMVEAADGVEALLVDEQGQVHRSSGASYRLVHPPRP